MNKLFHPEDPPEPGRLIGRVLGMVLGWVIFVCLMAAGVLGALGLLIRAARYFWASF